MTYEEIKYKHERYFDPEYLHKRIVCYAAKVAKKRKVNILEVLMDILGSGSTVASTIGEAHNFGE